MYVRMEIEKKKKDIESRVKLLPSPPPAVFGFESSDCWDDD